MSRVPERGYGWRERPIRASSRRGPVPSVRTVGMGLELVSVTGGFPTVETTHGWLPCLADSRFPKEAEDLAMYLAAGEVLPYPVIPVLDRLR